MSPCLEMDVLQIQSIPCWEHSYLHCRGVSFVSWLQIWGFTDVDILGFCGGASGKEPACQCRRHKRHWFDPWVGKILWKREWQPTPVFLPGESPWTEEPGGLQSTGLQRVRHDWSNWTHAHQFNILEWFFFFLYPQSIIFELFLFYYISYLHIYSIFLD